MLQVRPDSPLSGDLLSVCEAISGSVWVSERAVCTVLQVRPDSPLSGDLLSVCEAISGGSPAPPDPLAAICRTYRRQQRRTPPADRQPPAAQLSQLQLTQRESHRN